MLPSSSKPQQCESSFPSQSHSPRRLRSRQLKRHVRPLFHDTAAQNLSVGHARMRGTISIYGDTPAAARRCHQKPACGWLARRRGRSMPPALSPVEEGVGVIDRVATRWTIGRWRSLPMGKDEQAAQDVPVQWGQDWTGTEALESQVTPC